MCKFKRISKTLLSVALALSLVATIIPWGAVKSLAAPNSKLTFGVMSDLHYYPESLMGNDINAFIKACNLNSTTSYLSDAILDSAFAEFEANAKAKGLKYILVPGDLTKNSELVGHRQLAKKFKEFEDKTGIQIIVINGNHDIKNKDAAEFKNGNFTETTSASASDFRLIYADFGYDLADSFFTPTGANEAGGLSYAATLEGGYRLIALDGGRYSKDITESGENTAEVGGTYSPELMEWALSQIKDAKAKGLTVIGLTHFNLVPHFESEQSLFADFPITNWQEIAESFADAGMNYAFTGHIHMTDIASWTSDNGETLNDCASSSLINYPNYLRTVTMDNTASNGSVKVDYATTDVDNTKQVEAYGTIYEKPFKNKSFELNFGGKEFDSFVTNIVKYQIDYNLKPEIKKAGSLYNFLNAKLDLDSVLDSLLKSGTGISEIDGLTKTVLKKVVKNVCYQIEKAYIKDTTHLIEVLSAAVAKLTSIEVSDYPCTKYIDTLGFGDANKKGTLGDVISTCLASMYGGNEDTSDDKFIEDVMQKFKNGEKVDVIFDTLIDVVLHDVLENEVLKTIKIDIAGILKKTDDAKINEILESLFEEMKIDLLKPSLMDAVNLFFAIGIVDYKSLDDVLNSYMDEYLTKSQMDTIAYTLYDFVEDFTTDSTPFKKADNNSTILYNGKVEVVPTVKDLRLPSGIAVTFGQSASTTRNICWYTKTGVKETDIEIVPYSKNPKFKGVPTTGGNIIAKTEKVSREYPGVDIGMIGIIPYEFEVNRHSIKINSLKPGQKYCYRVGDAEKGWWSDVGVFETANNSDSFTFFHMSDSQGGIEKQYNVWGNVVDTAYKMYPDAKFIVHTGDFVDSGSNFRQWNWGLNASNNIKNTVIMPTAGNHEKSGNNAITNNFLISGLPEQDLTTGAYYSYDYNNAHFMVLNTNDLNENGSLSDKQTAWLKEDASKSTKQWKIVALHKAPYSNGSHYDDEDVIALRAQLSTLMNELNIDIVLQGHDHVYLRTDTMDDNKVVETVEKTIKNDGTEYTAKINPDGTIYVIDGCSGVKYYQTKNPADTDKLFPRAEKIVNAETPVFSAIQIEGGNLFFDAYSVGEKGTEKIDSFAISKGEASNENQTTEENTTDNESDENIDNEKIPTTAGKTIGKIALAILPISAAALIAASAIKKKKENE